MKWPLVSRKLYEKIVSDLDVLQKDRDRLKRENFALRGVMRGHSEELRKCRELLSRLRTGEKSATEAVERLFKETNA